MKKLLSVLGQVALWSCVAVLTGCSSAVTWKENGNGNIDLTKGGKVAVTSSCAMPAFEQDFLKKQAQENINKVLTGNADAPDAYQINIAINKYDPGNAFARSMLIGLGQMHLYGKIEILEGNPATVVCSGDIKKDYCVGGIAGGCATMQKDVITPVGKDIANAIGKKKVKK
jgi:hypothetical protein